MCIFFRISSFQWVQNTLHQLLPSQTQRKDTFEEHVSGIDNDLKQSFDVSSIRQSSTEKKTMGILKPVQSCNYISTYSPGIDNHEPSNHPISEDHSARSKKCKKLSSTSSSVTSDDHSAFASKQLTSMEIPCLLYTSRCV